MIQHKSVRTSILAVSLALSIFSCKKSSDAGSNITQSVVTDTAFYTVTGTGLTNVGEWLMSLNSPATGKLFFLNPLGSLVRSKPVNVQADNLQKWTIDGQIRYTYLESNSTVKLDPYLSTEIGYEMICDSALNILDSVRMISNGALDASVLDKLDLHEFILLGDHHYICETYYPLAVTNIPDSLHPVAGVKVDAPIIQEVNNGAVVFQWNGADYPAFYGESQEENDWTNTTIPQDYMHLNSITIDSSDNNLVVSFRHLDQIIKINRSTGDIMWRLGGTNSDFPLTTDQQFLRQHYARFTDNGKTLIFVDNGLSNGGSQDRTYSRILEFQLDEVNKVVTGFTAFKLPTPFIQFAGSVKKEGNFYYVGGGSASYAAVVDYTSGNVPLMIKSKYASYRALKY